MKKHRTVWGLVAAALGVTLLLVGVATASNMGFKFVPQIPGTAGHNAYNLSLPWNNNYTDAVSLYGDLGSGIQSVAKFESNSTLSSWLGPGSFTTNFTVKKGESYIVYGSGSGQTPVIVGSHDPSFTFTFAKGATNAAAPYHQTYTKASDLFNAINSTCGTKLTSVARFENNSTLSSWLGPGSFTTDFGLTLGQGVLVYTNSDCTGFVWAHY